MRDHCQLTGKHRGAAHNKCKRNVTEKQNNFISFVFHIFSKYNFHLFKTIIDEGEDEADLDFIPETNEEFIIINNIWLYRVD